MRTAVVTLLLVTTSGSSAAAGTDPWTDSARYSFEYRVDLARVGKGDGERIRVWVPHPADNADQRVLSADITAPWPHTIHRDAVGNRLVYLEGNGSPSGPLVMRFLIERRPSTGIPTTAATAGSPDDPARYRRAQRLIPLEGVIRDLAIKLSDGRQTDEEKIRAFYDYVVRNLRYSKDGKGWGRGDAIWACHNKRGNCTDFHSLFIGMARSQGIPARFIIGFPIPSAADEADVPGYHCWAEYYERTRGWVPLDASEGKKSGRPDAYFGTLPSDRVEFTTGRDLVLTPAQQGEPLNYFIYPYVEADGEPVEEVPATFRFRRVPSQTGTF